MADVLASVWWAWCAFAGTMLAAKAVLWLAWRGLLMAASLVRVEATPEPPPVPIRRRRGRDVVQRQEAFARWLAAQRVGGPTSLRDDNDPAFIALKKAMDDLQRRES